MPSSSEKRKEQPENPHQERARGENYLSTGILRVPDLTTTSTRDSQEECLNGLSTWMTELPPCVRLLPLTHLTIPGSHDSGAYDLKLWGKIRWDSFAQIKRWLKFIPLLTKPVIKRWSQTQKVDIRTQLQNGIRYFDMRVATKSEKGDFYFVHGLYGPKILKMCQEINCFLEEFPLEVVVLHFQHFYNVRCDRQRQLLNELLLVFGKKICPFHNSHQGWSLDDIREKQHQVLLFYSHSTPIHSPLLWPNDFLSNPWPNTTCSKQMISFLDEKLSSRSSHSFFVTQGVLTPNIEIPRRKVVSSLKRFLSFPANAVIHQWLGDKEAGCTGPNIVMTDFVEWNDYAIPRLVVSLNYRSCGNNIPVKDCQDCL